MTLTSLNTSRSTLLVAAAFAAAALLSSCSGGDDTGSDAVASGADVAALVGCTGFTNDSEELFVAEGGACDLEGQQVGVYYFADTDARDSYVEAGADFGGNYLVGENWAVDGPSEVLNTLQPDIGGDLSSEG